MKSHLKDKRSKNEQITAASLKKNSLENGWINYGNQRNHQLPHQYICPFEENVDSKLGRIDGIVTLEGLMEYAYEAKEKATTPCSVTSRGKGGVKNTPPMQCQPTEKPHSNKSVQSRKGENSTALPFNRSSVSGKSQLWMETANRWASDNENLNELTDEEKLTRAWTESLARWEAEKKNLLTEASKNHYALGKRFQNASVNNQQDSINQGKINETVISYDTVPPNLNGPYPFVMSKGDIKAFCFHWDQATESTRNALMIKFLKLYSGWGDPLNMDEVLNCGSKLLFMRFAFGFKVAFIKKYRCWRYIECLIIFLQSVEKITFAEQLMEINIVEDLLELVRYDESYLFDKLQSLYFLCILLEGPIGKVVVKFISSSGKLMDLLLEFFISCEDPQPLLFSRNILLTIINGTDLNTSQVILESISHLKFDEQTPLKIELMFQVIKYFLCMHPVIINNCGSLIMENLNTKDFNIMFGIAELAAMMLDHPQSISIIKAVFDKALSPLIDDTYRSEYTDFIHKSEERLQTANKNRSSYSNAKTYKCRTSSTQSRYSDRQGLRDIGTVRTTIRDTGCIQNEQFSALFVINYILENKDFSEVLSELGAIGLSLIATGQSFSKKIQQQGIRIIRSLHQLSFDCAASFTLLLSDEILSNILTRDIECLNEASSDVLLHMRQLGYLILENWNLWMEQVLLPTKRELQNDFESAVSKEDDYVVDLDYSNGSNKCQRIISKALSTPVGQQVAEIVEKLKFAWSKIEDDSCRNNSFSSSKLNAHENEGDQDTDSSITTVPDDWVTYNTNESQSKLLATYLSQARKNNDSYIEEIDDTDCESIPHSNDDNDGCSFSFLSESEDESGMSNFNSIPIKYCQATLNAKLAEKDHHKTMPCQDKNLDSLLSKKASLMRQMIQKYKKK